MIKRSYELLLLLILLLNACECVPTIETKKDIVPTQFANVAFFNLTDSIKYVNIYQNNIIVKDKLQNLLFNSQKEPEIIPSKVGINLTNISIFNSQDNSTSALVSPLLSFIADIKLNKYYSSFFYNNSSYIDCMFTEDSLNLFPKEHIKFRILNLSEENVNISVGNSSYFIEAQQHSNLLSCQRNNNKIQIIVKNKQNKNLDIIETNLLQQYMYNIIYKSGLYLAKYKIY